MRSLAANPTKRPISSPSAHISRSAGLNAQGLPLRSIEVRVDGGQWRKATLDPMNTRYSWQLFTYQWSDVPAGEHTIVSRAVDANGVMQPEQSALDQKKTIWENNGQFVRKFVI